MVRQMAPTATRRLGRAALVGLAAGLLLGSMYLVYQGTFHGRFDCVAEHVDTSECEFMIETRRQEALQQLAGAMGLALVAAGLVLWVRGKKPEEEVVAPGAPPPAGTEPPRS
jgi:hypothetical protein